MAEAKQMIRDLAQWMIDGQLVSAIKKDVFLDSTPDKPDSIVVISDTGSFGKKPGLDDHRRTVQIKTRAKKYEDARAKAWDIYNALCPQPTRTIVGNGRRMIPTPLQTPVFLERDDSGRSVFVFNVVLTTGPDS